MKKNIFILLLILFLFAASACGNRVGSEKIKVVVSIPPLADFVRQVGKEKVEVINIVPPGANAHTYEITPGQMRHLNSARLLVLNGAGLEYWAPRVIESLDNPRLRVIETAADIELLEEKESHDVHYGSGNPHVWLDPVLAVHQLEKIGKILQEIDPASAEFYRNNTEDYIARLHKLNEEIRQRVSKWENKNFVAGHSAWVYFARCYRLHQVAVIKPAPGREPSASHISHIVKLMKKHKVKVIFADIQSSDNMVRMVAEEGGAKVAKLDPLGGVEGRRSYEKLMRYNLEVMDDIFSEVQEKE